MESNKVNYQSVEPKAYCFVNRWMKKINLLTRKGP